MFFLTVFILNAQSDVLAFIPNEKDSNLCDWFEYSVANSTRSHITTTTRCPIKIHMSDEGFIAFYDQSSGVYGDLQNGLKYFNAAEHVSEQTKFKLTKKGLEFVSFEKYYDQMEDTLPYDIYPGDALSILKARHYRVLEDKIEELYSSDKYIAYSYDYTYIQTYTERSDFQSPLSEIKQSTDQNLIKILQRFSEQIDDNTSYTQTFSVDIEGLKTNDKDLIVERDDFNKKLTECSRDYVSLVPENNFFSIIVTEETCSGCDMTSEIIEPFYFCRNDFCRKIDINPTDISYKSPQLSYFDGTQTLVMNIETDQSIFIPSRHILLDRSLSLEIKKEYVEDRIFPVSKKGEELVVAIGKKYPPMFDLTQKTPVGFDVELSYELAKRLGKPGVKFLISKSPRMEIVNKKADLAIAAVSITPEREKIHTFSAPYLETNQVVVMKDKTKHTFDLKNLTCGYHSPIYRSILNKQGCTMKKYNSTTDVFTAVKNDEIDFTIVESISVPSDLYISEVVHSDSYGIVLPKILKEWDGTTNSEAYLHMKVNSILLQMEKDGTMDRIRSKHEIQTDINGSSTTLKNTDILLNQMDENISLGTNTRIKINKELMGNLLFGVGENIEYIILHEDKYFLNGWINLKSILEENQEERVFSPHEGIFFVEENELFLDVKTLSYMVRRGKVSLLFSDNFETEDAIIRTYVFHINGGE